MGVIGKLDRKFFNLYRIYVLIANVGVYILGPHPFCIPKREGILWISCGGDNDRVWVCEGKRCSGGDRVVFLVSSLLLLLPSFRCY